MLAAFAASSIDGLWRPDGFDYAQIARELYSGNEAGALEIVADIAGMTEGHDPRAHAEKVLEAIEAVIEKRATKDQESYTIKNRSLARTGSTPLLQGASATTSRAASPTPIVARDRPRSHASRPAPAITARSSA